MGRFLVTLLAAAGWSATALAQQPPGAAWAGFALANIALSTDRPTELAKWYRDVLGFQTVSQSPGVECVQTHIIERGGVQIDLIRVPSQRPREVPVDPPRHLEVQGLRNLVFWVDDLSAANSHLKAQGVPLIWEALYIEGIKTSITAFRDPDGNLIALWQRPR